jgi:hypothetical protein
MIRVTDSGSLRIDHTPVADRRVAALTRFHRAVGTAPLIAVPVLAIVALGFVNPILAGGIVMFGLLFGFFGYLYITSSGQWIEIDPARGLVRHRSDWNPGKPSLNYPFADFRAVRLTSYLVGSDGDGNMGTMEVGELTGRLGRILNLVFRDKDARTGPGRPSFDRLFEIVRSHEPSRKLAYDDASLNQMAARLSEVMRLPID